MKKIAANLALTGSLLITAAVLAPLFHSLDRDHEMGLLIDQAGRGNLETAEVVAQSNLSTGLFVQDAGIVARICGQDGQVAALVCQFFGPHLPNE